MSNVGEKTGLKSTIAAYLKLLRVKHYIKNILIFLPLFFSRSVFNLPLLARTVAAFVVFCLMSSCVYILNDIRDVEKDRKHPVKCRRPIASGRISVRIAVYTAMMVFAVAVVIAVLTRVPLPAIAYLALYIVLNVLYSCGLKNYAMVDIAILTSGFVLRVLYGSKVTGIVISNWMYLTILMASLYAAFGKRRNELAVSGDGDTRQVLKIYNYAFLDKCMYVALTAAIIFYSLWVISEFTGGPMILTIPLMIAIVLDYSLIVESGSQGDPVEVILGSPGLIVLAICWAAVVAFCLYFKL